MPCIFLSFSPRPFISQNEADIPNCMNFLLNLVLLDEKSCFHSRFERLFIRFYFPSHLKDAGSKLRYMANHTRRSIILFSEKGIVKAVTPHKLILDTNSGKSTEIYISGKIPCAPNDQIEVIFEISKFGYIARQLISSTKGQLWPILPVDFLILSEYLRFGLISLIGMITFIIAGLYFPLYFLSLIFPVFFGCLFLYYWVVAFIIGRNLPNYNRADVLSFTEISPNQKSQYFIKPDPQPLIILEGIFQIVEGFPMKIVSIHDKKEFILSNPPPFFKRLNNRKEKWIISIQNEKIRLLGGIQPDGTRFWVLNPVLSLGYLLQIVGYFVFFASIAPGLILYGLGTYVAFPEELVSSIFITCLFVGGSLILIGKLASLKKRRIQNNLLVDYSSMCANSIH